MAKYAPDFPLELIRKTFNAKIECLRSPDIDFGYEEVLPGEIRFVPHIPIKFSKRGRALFEERVKPLQPTGRAGKIRK